MDTPGGPPATDDDDAAPAAESPTAGKCLVYTHHIRY